MGDARSAGRSQENSGISTVELVDCSPLALLGQFLSTAGCRPLSSCSFVAGVMGGQQERLTYCRHRNHQHPYGQRLSCMACAASVTWSFAGVQRSLPCAGTRQNIVSLRLVANNWSYLSTTSSRAPVLGGASSSLWSPA
jgi:hypothetical protein